MPLITPDNLAEVLVALGALLSAIGGWTLWRSRKESSESPSADSAKLALLENTWAVKRLTELFASMDNQFEDNNKLFAQALVGVNAILFEQRESRRELNAIREHLSVIRDNQNRKN